MQHTISTSPETNTLHRLLAREAERLGVSLETVVYTALNQFCHIPEERWVRENRLREQVLPAQREAGLPTVRDELDALIEAIAEAQS